MHVPSLTRGKNEEKTIEDLFKFLCAKWLGFLFSVVFICLRKRFHCRRWFESLSIWNPSYLFKNGFAKSVLYDVKLDLPILFGGMIFLMYILFLISYGFCDCEEEKKIRLGFCIMELLQQDDSCILLLYNG